jgi:hypothetical protein
MEPVSRLAPDIALEVGRMISSVQEDWKSHAMGIGEIAARHAVIPLLLDMGGFFGLRLG